MSEHEPPVLTFGQRHPIVIALAIVFVAGFALGAPADFLSGQLEGQNGFIITGLAGGIGAVAIFVVLSVTLALTITIVQAVLRALGWRSADCKGAEATPFRRRFRRNLEQTNDFWIQGWH
jgi:hypothetical protein